MDRRLALIQDQGFAKQTLLSGDMPRALGSPPKAEARKVRHSRGRLGAA